MRKNRTGWRATIVVVAVTTMLAVIAGPANAAVVHGIGFTKGCLTPTVIGQKTKCNFTFLNNVDTAHDTLTISSLVDVVTDAAGGAQSSGNILSSLDLTFTVGGGGLPTCSPGQTSCALPWGSKISTATPFQFHTVVSNDGTAGILHDTATLTWQDTCDSGATNCPLGSNTSSTGSQTAVTKLTSTTVTTIHDAAHTNIPLVGGVAVIELGKTVHDRAAVTGSGATPTGSVDFSFFNNLNCTGTAADTALGISLVGGAADATSFTKTPGVGEYGFMAHYNGDPNYNASDGACEPLRVVDARITITPPSPTNEVGQAHTFTVTVEKNLGTGGYVAAAGEHVAFSLVDSLGAASTVNTASSTCDDLGANTNASGQCTIVFSSPSAGRTTANAYVTLNVGGVSLTRDTDPATSSVGSGTGGSGPAVKTWVDAKISITPGNATNEVGQAHTFTVAVLQNDGSGSGFVAPPNGTSVTVTFTDSNGATHNTSSDTCLNPPGAGTVSGSCTVTFTSNGAGQVVGHATVTLTVGGLTVTRATDSTHGSTGDANKTFVDGKISITADATNRVGQPHTFTVSVLQDAGQGAGFVAPPDGTIVTVTLTDSAGASHTTSTDTCAGTGTVSGVCTITFSSATAGKVTGHASVSLTVGGVTFTRATDGTHGSSNDVVKTYVNAKISIVASATNAVGAPHTFTVTLMKDTGTGTFVAASGEHVTVTLTDANGASHTTPTGTCTNAGANTDVNGQCTITFNSNSAGTVTGHATSTLSVNGSASFTVATDGVSPNSSDAVKTYVDANIQISPLSATNPVGTNHTLAGHVNVNPGTGFVNAPDGLTITFAIVSGPGSFVGAVNTCTTAGGTGSCSVQITSPTTGTTVVSASSSPVVGGVTLPRTTNGSGANSGNASKIWADDTIVTQVHNASHTDITNGTVTTGTAVHDRAAVSGTAGTPVGTVTFSLFHTNNCSGALVGSTQTVALNGSGVAETTAVQPASAGAYSFLAHFNGQSGVYPARDAGCEPFTVISATCVLGYPDSSNNPRSSVVFTESGVLRTFAVLGAGATAQIAAWYNDEHALTLGVRRVVNITSGGTTTTDYPFTTMTTAAPTPGNPAHATNPLVGATYAQGNKDLAAGGGRPMFPALFVTDITASASSRVGDWQQGSDTSFSPNDVFGSWKGAVRTVKSTSNPAQVTVTPDADPAKNNWNLGVGADTPPGGFAAYANEGYGAEARWNASALGLQSGHVYRMVLMVHDGDQNKTGGDSGEGCANLFIP